MRPISFPFGDIGLDDSLLLDNQARHAAVIAQPPHTSAGSDNSLRLYDVTARTQLGDAIDLGNVGPDSPTAAFRTNGTELAVDTEHGIVVWDLDPAHWVDAACDVAGRNLTHTEWDQYMGDLAPIGRRVPNSQSTDRSRPIAPTDRQANSTGCVGRSKRTSGSIRTRISPRARAWAAAI